RLLGDRDVRWNALHALRTIGTSEDAARVVGFVSDPEPGIGREALRALGSMPSPIARDTLVRVLDQPQATNRDGAAEGNARQPDADSGRLQLLLKATDESVREAAALGLAERGRDEDLALLLPFVADPRYFEVAEAILRHANPAWVPVMRRLASASE